jgi:hypothetical protein
MARTLLRLIFTLTLLIVALSATSQEQCATDLKQSPTANPPTQCVPSTKTTSNHNMVVPDNERLALIALYKSTNGDHWKNHKGWLGSPGTECNWYGVECEEITSSANVISLDLRDNNLTGNLPDELDQFTQLVWLDLEQNQISGAMPAGIGHLSSLTWLGLTQNSFSGLVPYRLIRRWLSGSLFIAGESKLLSDVSQIDYESNPSSLLCGRYRYILNQDNSVVDYRKRCRNALPQDRSKYCEIKKGSIPPYEFPRLGWLIEQNKFFDLKPGYDRNITEGTFENTQVTKSGKTHVVSNYASAGPFELWTIQRAIEGVVLPQSGNKQAHKKTVSIGNCCIL